MSTTPDTRHPTPARRHRRLAARVLALLLVSIVGLGMGGAGTYAAFRSSTTNSGDVVAVGTMGLTDNDGGAAAFTVSGLAPNSVQTKCIRVTSTGSLDSKVRMYALTSGALAPYVAVKITRGSISSPSFPSCTGFSADATSYMGAGAGVVYADTLSNFPSTWAAGIADPPSGTQETWTTGESHDYKIELFVGDNRGAEGSSATATFNWEARDVSSSNASDSYSTLINGTSGLLSYWRLGEASGSTAADEKGAVNGTYTNGTTLSRPGLIAAGSNSAAGFDATDDLVSMGDNYDFAGTAPFTAEAWIKPSSLARGVYRRIVDKTVAAGGGWAMFIVASDNGAFNDRIGFERSDSSGAADGVYGGSVDMVPGKRAYVVVTYDGTTLKLYVNGSLDGSAVSSKVVPNGTGPLNIGGTTYSTENFDGTIDEAALYNRALSAAEVTSHWNAGQ